MWTWEIPAYFFVGGAAGAAAVVAAVARVAGADPALVRDARWLAAVGGAASPALLVSDLGRPERFLNMLRVFKLRSPMSVGAWTLVAFSNAAGANAFANALVRTSRGGLPIRVVANAAEVLSAATGLVLSTYTGVLIGATAVPVWSRNVSLLPVHFGASGVGAAVSILELMGHRDRALNALGIGAAAVETAIGIILESNDDPALDPHQARVVGGGDAARRRAVGTSAARAARRRRPLDDGATYRGRVDNRRFAADAGRLAGGRAGVCEVRESRIPPIARIPMPRHLLESIRGVGTIYAGEVLLRTTTYDLSLWSDDDQPRAGGRSGDRRSPGSMVTSRSAASRRPSSSPVPGTLTLTLEDGRRLAFELTGYRRRHRRSRLVGVSSARRARASPVSQLSFGKASELVRDGAHTPRG